MADQHPTPLALDDELRDWATDGPADADAVRDVQALIGEIATMPVPVRPRADGWTTAKQLAFVRWLGDLGSVAEAAAMVGMSTAGAYRLRKRAGAASFATAWDGALLHAGEDLMARSIRRAVDGTAIPVIRGRRITRVRRVYDDGLLMKLIQRVDGRKQRRQHRRALP